MLGREGAGDWGFGFEFLLAHYPVTLCGFGASLPGDEIIVQLWLLWLRGRKDLDMWTQGRARVPVSGDLV